MTPRTFGLIAGLSFLLVFTLSAQMTGPHNGPVMPSLYVYRIDKPPVQYAEWYRSMEKCTGMKGSYRRIKWLMVQAPWITGQRKTHGSWQGDNDNGTAKVVVNAEEWMDSTLVTHEALHDILWRNGFTLPDLPPWATDTDSIEAKHPKPWFGRCAPTYYDDRKAPSGS
jgi:hypothetical protein